MIATIRSGIYFTFMLKKDTIHFLFKSIFLEKVFFLRKLTYFFSLSLSFLILN